MFRKTEPVRSPVDINRIIRTVLTLVRVDIQNHGISVQVDLDDGIEPILADRVQLQQLVLNLVMNAIEAMQSGYPRVLHVMSEQTGAGVLVSIEDSGAGIDRANLRRLFEPLFTTKARGMGIGLSICKSIIDGHSGEIWVEPAAGRGSIFRFRLPAQEISANIAA
jgi:signal transduction histidine kinase